MEFAISRHFTASSQKVVDSIRWKWIRVGPQKLSVEVPEFWSETAAEIAATRYLRLSLGETSVRPLFERVVGDICESGVAQGRISLAAAEVLAEELLYILLRQMASFNSPVYFNAGIFAKYGLDGQAENFAWDAASQSVLPTVSAYVRPQVSACFIQSVEDDLLSIFDLLRSEAKLFKYGSGTGTNFSRLRAKGARLDGGGESSGLLSFLEIFDKAAQAIKSGGTNRRAAKMVILDAEHPEILEFINWKRDEERKARVLLAAGYSGGMDGQALRTVSGQNSNNSVRVTDQFVREALAGHGRPAEILQAIATAAWECADPGLQFHDTIQRWHLCPGDGPIRGSNPCSEYMFLDDTACNLSSLNLARFLHGGQFQWKDFAQVIRLMLLAQDILVDHASYPTHKIASQSHTYRPLGLGYSNLGGLLLRLGIPYDSGAAAEWTIRITGALHALALTTSAELAAVHGPFSRWEQNRPSALQVLEQHRHEWLARRPADMSWLDEVFEAVWLQAQATGLRNAQVTLIAPTGTIGLLMDCETLGIEPEFALVKRKVMSEGGELRLVNGSVEAALETLGYSKSQRLEMLQSLERTGWMVEAPHLRPEHESVFDCAMAAPGRPERRVTVEGHLRIMAAAQPFLSGAISKTVNLPSAVTPDEILQVFVSAWTLGLKSIAIYRDTSKTLQPLCAEC